MPMQNFGLNIAQNLCPKILFEFIIERDFLEKVRKEKFRRIVFEETKVSNLIRS